MFDIPKYQRTLGAVKNFKPVNVVLYASDQVRYRLSRYHLRHSLDKSGP